MTQFTPHLPSFSPDALQEKHLVVYSGGMDSYTLLHYVRMGLERGRVQSIEDSLRTLSFAYGQRHVRELESVRHVVGRWNIHHLFFPMNMGEIFRASHSALLSSSAAPIPQGHYAAETMKQTVVPGRNTLMLAHALALCQAWWPDDACTLYYGAHAGDHTIYPDCRPAFIEAMGSAIYQASDGRVSLSAPWQHMSKACILKQGLYMREHGALVDYAETWTCYEGGARPCGKCGACIERAEAFELCGAADPLLS